MIHISIIMVCMNKGVIKIKTTLYAVAHEKTLEELKPGEVFVGIMDDALKGHPCMVLDPNSNLRTFPGEEFKLPIVRLDDGTVYWCEPNDFVEPRSYAELVY